MELLKARKSGFEDSFFLIIVLFVLCIFVLVLLTAWNGIKTPLNTGILSSMPNSTINITTTINETTSTLTMFDKLLPFFLIGLFAFVLIGASVYLNHPIMLIVGIILLSVAILLGVIYANVYNQISHNETMSEANSSLTIQELFMKYLPYIVLILITGVIIYVIFMRNGGVQQL